MRGTPSRDGTSTITLVALTTQTASSPTFRPSSSTASAVIRLTSRCGPAMTSTTAATRSFSMRVTMPGNRFRADRATIGRSVDCLAALGEQAGDLVDRDEPLAAVGALHPQPALGLPAPQRLDGDAEHLGRLADADARHGMFAGSSGYRLSIGQSEHLCLGVTRLVPRDATPVGVP